MAFDRSEYQKKYRRRNHAEFLAYEAKWREKNRDKSNASAARYRKSPKGQKFYKAWIKKNKTKMAAYGKQWYVNNRKRLKAVRHKWYLENREKVKQKGKARREKLGDVYREFRRKQHLRFRDRDIANGRKWHRKNRQQQSDYNRRKRYDAAFLELLKLSVALKAA